MGCLVTDWVGGPDGRGMDALFFACCLGNLENIKGWCLDTQSFDGRSRPGGWRVDGGHFCFGGWGLNVKVFFGYEMLRKVHFWIRDDFSCSNVGHGLGRY